MEKNDKVIAAAPDPEERAAKPPKQYQYVGEENHAPIIRFDGDPNIYRANQLTQALIQRYIKETPDQKLFALK